MNTRYFIRPALFSAIMVLLLVGCKKYLDQKPITDVSTDVVFKDVPSAYRALAGVYSRLIGDQGYGIRLSLYFPVDNDETQGPTGNGDNDRRDIARYNLNSGNLQIEKPFNQLFQGIEYANICIDNIPKMDMYNNGSDQEKKQLRRMYGEALTLRAQFYFEAIRNWGDLPAHFKPAYAQASDDPFPHRTDRDTLYTQILADLKAAEDVVPWKNEVVGMGDQVDERITKGVVKGLRARIALFRAGWSLRQTGGMKQGSNPATYYQIARDECNDIIQSNQHSLNPSFKALWKDQVCAHAVADPQGELMFQASAIGGTGAEDSKLGYYNGPTVNGLGNKSINIMPNYFYLFDSTDLRRDVTCAPYNVAANGTTKLGQAITAICDGKYRRDWITNPSFAPTNAIQYFGLKWQILRYADVLLMFAETENELNGGPTTAAYNAINMVRRRGYGKPLNTADATCDLPSGLSKTAFFTAIVKERSLEFGGEGIRKYDLLRWNLLASTITNEKAVLTAMSNSTAPFDKLPKEMLFFTNSAADNGALWANSFYTYTPLSDPAVVYNTQTTNYALPGSEYGVIAKAQTITITLPDAVANNGKIYWVRMQPNNPAATSTAAWTYTMKVNTSGGQFYDGGTSNSLSYTGSVAAAGAANPPNMNGPVKTFGFLSNGSGWVSATSVVWNGTTINSTALSRYATNFTTGRSELLPIPQAARDANVHFDQNPNY